MIEWIIAGAAALIAGGLAARRVSKKKVHGDWSERLTEVAQRVGGRASPATADDHPQLRAELEGLTVTLELIDIHAGARGRVQTQAGLPDPDNTSRLYLGWDALETPKDLTHIPKQTTGPTRLEGQVELRADDAVFGARVLQGAALQLADLRREGQGRALELVLRGGYLTLIVYGLEPTTAILIRGLEVTARLAHLVDEASRGTQLPAGPSEAPALPAPASAVDPETRCELCGDTASPDTPWVRCRACGTAYHERCFLQATACLVAGCSGTHADRVSGSP